jgi:para-aminobenzoate synthetase component 2
VVRNDAISVADVIARDPQAIILSPGPGTPDQAGICLDIVRAASHIPLLGVCLGHQCIAQAYGGTVSRAVRPVHGKASLIEHDGRGVFQYIPSPLKVGRYHSLVTTLAPQGPLVATATTANQDGHQEIMALAHQSLPQVGVQFHPESILTEHGDDIITNFLNFAIGWRLDLDTSAEAAQ